MVGEGSGVVGWNSDFVSLAPAGKLVDGGAHERQVLSISFTIPALKPTKCFFFPFSF